MWMDNGQWVIEDGERGSLYNDCSKIVRLGFVRNGLSFTANMKGILMEMRFLNSSIVSYCSGTHTHEQSTFKSTHLVLLLEDMLMNHAFRWATLRSLASSVFHKFSSVCSFIYLCLSFPFFLVNDLLDTAATGWHLVNSVAMLVLVGSVSSHVLSTLFSLSMWVSTKLQKGSSDASVAFFCV